MINNKIRRQLDAIDWDFPVSYAGETKLAHWYPGTFPSSLPAAFIQALSNPGDVIFDPYGGGGTTAAEAIRLGRKALIADINPISILASYSFVSALILKSYDKLDLFFDYFSNLINPIKGDLLDFDSTEIFQQPFDIDDILSQHIKPSPKDILASIRKRNEIQLENLHKWIDSETLAEIINIRNQVLESTNSNFVKLYFESMVSSNLRALCSQNKSWGHIADNVFPKEFIFKNSRSQFSKWLKIQKKNLRNVKLEKTKKFEGIQFWANLHNWNLEQAMKETPKSGADLIITSPPYGDAIDYINSQKLSLYYLGYNDEEISSLCSMEIGARRKRSKTNSRQKWANEISESAIKQSKYLINGKFVAILPHKDHGREIGLKLLIEGLKNNGWQNNFQVDRSINQKKTRQSWTSIKQETICIFTRNK